jgi:hypothetical protein
MDVTLQDLIQLLVDCILHNHNRNRNGNRNQMKLKLKLIYQMDYHKKNNVEV